MASPRATVVEPSPWSVLVTASDRTGTLLAFTRAATPSKIALIGELASIMSLPPPFAAATSGRTRRRRAPRGPHHALLSTAYERHAGWSRTTWLHRVARGRPRSRCSPAGACQGRRRVRRARYRRKARHLGGTPRGEARPTEALEPRAGRSPPRSDPVTAEEERSRCSPGRRASSD